MAQAVNLAAKLATFDEMWSPRTVASFNGHDVMVVKVEGEFRWHSHADTDDIFLVLSGEIDIQLRDGPVTLKVGEMFVVPKGVSIAPSPERKRIFCLSSRPGPRTLGLPRRPPRVKSSEDVAGLGS